MRVNLVLLANGTALDVAADVGSEAGPPEFRGDQLAGFQESGVTGRLIVEIGTSLGRYPDFPPIPEPFLSCPSPYSEFPITCYRYRTTPAYFGLYWFRPVITLSV